MAATLREHLTANDIDASVVRSRIEVVWDLLRILRITSVYNWRLREHMIGNLGMIRYFIIFLP